MDHQIGIQIKFCGKKTTNMHNISFERDVCYAAAPHTPLKLGVICRPTVEQIE